MPIEKAQEQWNQPQPMEDVLSPATRVALRFGIAVFVIVHQYGLSVLIIVFTLLTALKIYNLMIWGTSREFCINGILYSRCYQKSTHMAHSVNNNWIFMPH